MAETLYVLCNAVVLPGWLLLIFAPRWKWTTSLVTTVLIPFVLGLVYFALIVTHIPVLLNSGSFLHLADVARLFENPYCLLAGWVHYLAFDLVVGSWQVRDAQRVGLPHWAVMPCLILTFVLGPTGLVCYFLLRGMLARRVFIDE